MDKNSEIFDIYLNTINKYAHRHFSLKFTMRRYLKFMLSKLPLSKKEVASIYWLLHHDFTFYNMFDLLNLTAACSDDDTNDIDLVKSGFYKHLADLKLPNDAYTQMDAVSQSFASNHTNWATRHHYHDAIAFMIILFIASFLFPTFLIDDINYAGLIATKGVGYFLLMAFKGVLTPASIDRVILNLVVDIPLYRHEHKHNWSKYF